MKSFKSKSYYRKRKDKLKLKNQLLDRANWGDEDIDVQKHEKTITILPDCEYVKRTEWTDQM